MRPNNFLGSYTMLQRKWQVVKYLVVFLSFQKAVLELVYRQMKLFHLVDFLY